MKTMKQFIRSMANNTGNCDEKYIRTKFSSNDDLPLER